MDANDLDKLIVSEIINLDNPIELREDFLLAIPEEPTFEDARKKLEKDNLNRYQQDYLE
ncbi:hypothetical protein VTI74DRAFT_1235 [Chaetomium olivicolor]